MQRGIAVRRAAPPDHPAIKVMDLVIESEVQKLDRPMRLMQIGANDGKTMDPVYELIRRHQMEVALVEPVPEAFRKLQMNYADYDRATLINAAVGNEDGELPLYVLINDDPDLDGTLVASFSRDSVKKHLRYFNNIQRIKKIMVRSKTIPSLLREWGQKDIDFLQCDVEGFDAVVVGAVLNAGYLPKVINFEYVHLSWQDRQQVSDLLRAHGYRLLNQGFDTLAWRCEA